MGTTTESLTIDARYAAARAQGTTPTRWREMARAYNRLADTAWSLVERRRFRRLAEKCQRAAERIVELRTALKSVAA